MARRNPSRRGRKAELFVSIDVDSRKGSTSDEGRWLRRCHFLPEAPIRPASASPATHAISHDCREEADAVENREKVGLSGRYKVLARKRKGIADDDGSGFSSGGPLKDRVGKGCVLNARCDTFRDNESNAATMVTKEGFPSLSEKQTGNMVVEYGPKLITDHCIDPRYVEDFSLNAEHNNVGVEKESRMPRSAQKGLVAMDVTEKGKTGVANGCRPIADYPTGSEYSKDYDFNTKYGDAGFEKGSGNSASAKEAFLELNNGQTRNVEFASTSRISGEQRSKAGHGKVAGGTPKPVATATRKLPPSIIVSYGDKGFAKSPANSRFYYPLPEKEISDHDSSGSSSYISAPCDNGTSQEVNSDSTSFGNLLDTINTFSRRQDRRIEKADILTLAIEKGFNFPPPRWWRPGGYDAEELTHGKGRLH